MSKRGVVAWAAGLFAGVALAGCSESNEPAKIPGALSAGTAEITIDGALVESTNDVKCTSGGSVTTIDTGDENSGTTTAVDTAEKPTVQFAEFRGIGGFTGSYWDRLGPRGEVQVTGGTFLIKGTADGFTEENPSARVSNTFAIKVAC